MINPGARFTLFSLAVALTAFALPSLAELYRWVDENGRVHYSDTPPPANAKTEKEVKGTARPPTASEPAAPAGQAPKSYVEKEAEFRKRQVEQAERDAAAKKAQQESAEKKRNCEQSRNQLAALKAGGRFVRYNADGEREYMDEQQIAQEISRAEKAVAGWCN